MWFSQELKEAAFAPREVIAGKDARQLARELLAMSQEQFSAAFKNSPIKRAKLRGLKRNAAVVLGNVGSADDVRMLVPALSDDEPLVRAHAAWALGRSDVSSASGILRDRVTTETPEADVRAAQQAALDAHTSVAL